MASKKALYEDESKKVFETDADDQLMLSFTDTIISLDGKKKGKMRGKGNINNAIAAHLFEYLESFHIRTHFISKINEREMQIRKTEKIPISVKINNFATADLTKRFGFEKNATLPVPVVEYYYEQEKLNNPVINDTHAASLGIASEDDMRTIMHDSLKINALLKPFFERRNINLVGLTLSFGKYKGRIVLTSAIIPDTCHLWDLDTSDNLDRARYDGELAKVSDAYKEVFARIIGEN